MKRTICVLAGMVALAAAALLAPTASAAADAGTLVLTNGGRTLAPEPAAITAADIDTASAAFLAQTLVYTGAVFLVLFVGALATIGLRHNDTVPEVTASLGRWDGWA